MKYFEITDWFDQPGRWYLGSPKNRSGVELDPRLFTEGRKYQGETVYPPPGQSLGNDFSAETPFEIPIRQGTSRLDFTFGSFGMPIVTETIGEQLEACCPNRLQLIPARICGLNCGFEILNVTTLVDAVDLETSEISWRTNANNLGNETRSIAGIGRLVLRASVLNGICVFRLQGWELPLIVDQTVKEVLTKLRATGVRFQEIPTT